MILSLGVIAFLSTCCLEVISWKFPSSLPLAFSLKSSNLASFDRNKVRLAIDYGPRNIGLAYSNVLGQIRPYQTIPNTRNLTSISHSILAVARSLQVQEMLLGIPCDADGILSYDIKNFNGRLCLQFSRVLAAYLRASSVPYTIPLYLCNEQFSTQEARHKLRCTKERSSLDAMAAVSILSCYVEDNIIRMNQEGSIMAVPYSLPLSRQQELLDYSKVSNYVRKYNSY